MRWAALLLLTTLPAMPSYARARHASSHHGEAWARDHFAAAERMREALNGRPPADRTRRSYQRVIDAYRSIYYGAPTSTKADPSVVAVAETMVEMGRRFDDDKILNDAIGQYRFLRKEYPGSKYRCDALFTIGEIYNDDLNNLDKARATFEEFLYRYPHNRLAGDAQNAIADLDRQAKAAKKTGPDQKRTTNREVAGKDVAGKDALRDKDKAVSGATATVAKTDSSAKTDSTAKNNDEGADDTAQDSPATTSDRQSEPRQSDSQAGQFPRVTGIRHWSTPDYTRVAIDLESEVKFGSQRIANPDRIFFDLRDTKLASTLVGKSFDVDDGFLKKIRVAQFEPGRTRVVLEVEDLSDYDAFLLPNPYRLIIDIHGKDFHAKDKIAAARELQEAMTATADVESEPKAGGTKDSAAIDTPAADPKADLRAQAGKAPVTRQDVGDNTKIGPRGETTSAKVNAAGELPAVTKVVVDNDDDDDTAPVKTKAGTSGKRSVVAAARKKNDTSVAASAGDDSTDDDSPVDSRTSSAHGKTSSRASSRSGASDSDIREARPTASGDRSLIRALGLKIGKIVIDPGHGGHDTGTIGPNGLEEKDLVLEVGRRLGKLLETRLGAEVVYTRKNDTFIPLETRTAIANQQRADLFISIHANSSHDPDARGVETYYLNFTSSPDALEVAARENAVSEKSIYELGDLVKKIALKEKIEESREFAGDVQESLHSGLAAKSPGIRDRGVKKAPFIVLIGANMPSILAEISFVSNPGDEHRLETSDYRQRIAESLYRGIAKYVNGLSGVKVASKMDHSAGQ
jgi:N-acetylmuramoyl-L-alanine amidase